MKTHFTKKEQIVILVVVSIIVLVVGFKFLSKDLLTNNDQANQLIVNRDKLENEEKRQDREEEEIKKEDQEEYKGNIIVHISGQVKSPGIVELKSGQRLIDAVVLLGGLTQDADEDRINLARKLGDEEKIYIPKIGEEIEIDLLEVEGTPNKEGKSDPASDDKIDLNICTKEDLMNLPGIGDVLSGNIIAYRDDNIFKAIEDVMNVSGVGAKKFEGIKDLIIVK